MYADDVKISRQIQSGQDCLDLQSDLLQLESWSKTWLLKFNPIKCKVMSICRNIKFDFPYKLCSVILEENTELSDLGITLTSNLSWKMHICSKLSKANRTLAFIP